MSVQGICRRYVRSVLLVVQRQSENNCRCGNLVSLGARSQLACSPSAWDLYFCYEADWLREVKALLTGGAQSEVNVNVESVVSCRHLGHMLTTRNVRIICYEINFR
jgi:L-lysine 2,3-aminomutase